MEDIGRKIRELRQQKGMTLEELGNRVGVGKSTVLKWESGAIENMRRDPSTCRQMAIRGGFQTARKIGRNWVIDDSEIYPDHRKKESKNV